MSDPFEDLFRPSPTGLATQSIFTDREEERSFFRTILEEHRLWASEVDTLNPNIPRANLVNFFGIGGIGKSTLLRFLADFVTAQGLAAVLIDFQEPAAFNIEDCLLRIRAGALQLEAPLNAFDLALALYWRTVHPEQPIEEYVRENPFVKAVRHKLGVSDSLRDSVAEIASAIGGASALAKAGAKVSTLLVRSLRRHHASRQALSSCPALERFLDPETIAGAIGYMPALLSWDLHQVHPKGLVVLMDTYEEVTKRGVKFEASIQRLCYLMPDVLFVIAGRNRLTWDTAESTGVLPYSGPSRWPGLMDDYSCRLMGDFSPEDADRYLRERLVLEGSPALPAPIRSKIVEASSGWPLYLQVSADYYQQLSVGGEVDPGMFGEPFPALVRRLVSDLTAEEQDVVAAAALLGFFDEAALAAAAGSVRHACVEQVLRRPFVREDTRDFWPFSLHPALREAVLADSSLWGPRDYAGAANRILTYLGGEITSGGVEEENLVTILTVVLPIADRYSAWADWLSDAARGAYASGGLEAITPPSGTPSTPAAALQLFLSTLSEQASLSFGEFRAKLGSIPDGRLAERDAYWLKSLTADTFLSDGHDDEAEAQYRLLLTNPPDGVSTAEVRTMFGLTLLRRGLFKELDDQCDAESEINVNRLRGDVARYSGQMGRAKACYEAGLSQSETLHDRGLTRLLRAELALVDGWVGIDPSGWDEEGEGLLAAWTRVQHLVAHALYSATSEPAAGTAFAERALEVAHRLELFDGLVDATVAKGLIAAVAQDYRGLDRSLAELGQLLDGRSIHRHWLEVLTWWGGAPGGSSTVSWPNGVAEAHLFWTRLLRRRQEGRRTWRA